MGLLVHSAVFAIILSTLAVVENTSAETLYPVSPDADSRCTAHWEATSLFYNRIPKAGSTTLRAVLWRLSRGLGFSFHSSNDYTDRGWFEKSKEKANAKRIRLVLDMDKRSTHSMYDQHVRYINFTRHGYEQPAYINMMRDPVSRLISTYYYALRGKNVNKDRIMNKLSGQVNWSLEECIQRKEECKWLLKKSLKDFNLMTAFFCGHNPECMTITPAALETAKKHLRENFVFVGLTERFKESMLLFEALLPQYFTAGVEALASIDKLNVNNNVTNPMLSVSSRDVLANLASYDYELYNYAESLMNTKMNCIAPVREDPPKRSNQRM